MLRTTPIPPTKGKQTKPIKINKGRGRPSKFSALIEQQIMILIQEGWIDIKICELVGISPGTLYTWKKNNPEFLKSIKKGKQEHDQPVTDSIFESSIGKYRKEIKVFKDAKGNVTGSTETIKWCPPDATLAIFWKCNRDVDNWKRNRDTKVDGGDGLDLEAWKEGGYKTACDFDRFTDSEKELSA